MVGFPLSTATIEWFSPIQKLEHLWEIIWLKKLKKTYWYFMNTGYDGLLVPQIEENIEKAIWVDKNKIPSLMQNAYANIKLIVEEGI